MKLAEGSTVVAELTTIGRKTGLARKVELRFLYYQGNFYATSSKVAGKHWCQNLLKNPAVEISAKGERFGCMAKQITDESLRKHVLTLRDSRPQLERIVFEIRPSR